MRIRLLCIILLFSSVVHAQVWTLKKKGIYANISFSAAMYTEGFDSTGETFVLPRAVEDKTIALFAQYGITDKITAQITLPYKMTATGDPAVAFSPYEYDGPLPLEGGKLNYWGNIEVGAMYKLMEDKPIITASFFVEANTSDRNYITGLQTGFNSWGFIPGIGAGWPFEKSWLTYYLGGDIRTNHYSSSILSKIEYGYKPAPFVYFAVTGNLKRSLKNGDDCDCTTAYRSLYLNNQEYIAGGLKAGFLFGKWGANFAVNGALSAANAPVALVPSIGVQYKKE